MTPFAPGLYPDIDDHDYHADPALSSTGARKILFTSPAEFHYERAHGAAPKKEYDEGHAAHRYVLGKGSDIVVVDADSWRTNDAKAARDQAYAEGRVPLLPTQDEMARKMADTVLSDPIAGPLFAEGEAEQSGWWRDAETGAMLRIRPDWMTTIGTRLVIVDYKTSKDAGKRLFAKAAAAYGYYMQQPYYVDGVRALGLSDDPAFVFVTQCKQPPYVVTVTQLTPEDVTLGRDLNRAAIRLFAECETAGVWPTRNDRIHITPLPMWIHYQGEEILS
ncbi:PD-(D/E)XK nuclease-like domain-containing protein [Nocardia cyriacigeorgica]|uniref:PD-(D/E)XK nuclease-like domain-containing protein n=1 Tax=Nocardia cyriacigeorgica TaxID=135487 RepID=UPI002455DF33|nr:PD-(D/E)XK nuclease-like domain-containing protein [Nocardia cyriacigeorgica]